MVCVFPLSPLYTLVLRASRITQATIHSPTFQLPQYATNTHPRQRRRLIYGYTLVIPIVLYGALRYFGSESANLLECWALYGYSNLIWIPVALISWSPLTILNWVFVGVGWAVSVAFLLRNLYPVLSATDRQTSKILLVLVVALHMGLALAIKILFFAAGSPVANNPPATGGGDKDAPKGGDAGDTTRAFF